MSHYHNSRGEAVEIATMPTRHMRNALAKLEREEPDRGDEIMALTRAIAQREAEWAADHPDGEEMPS